MDGGRRRRLRTAEGFSRDDVRAAWYAWWRAARFAAHFGGRERPAPQRFRRRELAREALGA